MATQAPPAVKKVPEEKPSVIQPMVYKSVVTVYRIFAIITLYLVLVGVLAYGFVMGFYALNTSWAAPVIAARRRPVSSTVRSRSSARRPAPRSPRSACRG